MSTSTTLFLKNCTPRLEVKPAPGGEVRATITAGDDVHETQVAIFGSPEEVVAILTGWARQATDLAVTLLTPEAPTTTPLYSPTGLCLDGVEITTSRLACCGAGPDQVHAGVRQHLPGCTDDSFKTDAMVEHIRRQAEAQVA
jgi:hypothetical protein